MKVRILFATMIILFMCCVMPAEAKGRSVEAAKSDEISSVDKVKEAKIEIPKPSKVQFTNKCISKAESVTLCWKRSDRADGYVIYRSTKKNSGYIEVKIIKNPDTLKWIDKKLKDNVTYFYKVRPYIKTKEKKVYGAYSNVYEKVLIPKAMEQVRKYTYVDYVSGGESPKGWDCSGFTQWFYKTYYGKTLPRSSREQAKVGTSIDKNNMSKWKPGDILVYAAGGSVNHVGLYLGNGKNDACIEQKVRYSHSGCKRI